MYYEKRTNANGESYRQKERSPIRPAGRCGSGEAPAAFRHPQIPHGACPIARAQRRGQVSSCVQSEANFSGSQNGAKCFHWKQLQENGPVAGAGKRSQFGAGGRGRTTDDRGQTTDDGGQTTDDGGQGTDDRGRPADGAKQSQFPRFGAQKRGSAGKESQLVDFGGRGSGRLGGAGVGYPDRLWYTWDRPIGSQTTRKTSLGRI